MCLSLVITNHRTVNKIYIQIVVVKADCFRSVAYMDNGVNTAENMENQ